jgi:hypothetical protein
MEYMTILKEPKALSVSDIGTRIIQPISEPTNVEGPPTAVATKGKIEKSVANKETPTHPYRWVR